MVLEKGNFEWTKEQLAVARAKGIVINDKWQKPSYEGEWVPTSDCRVDYSPVYFIQKAKKLEGWHFYMVIILKSGASNSCSYQWNLPALRKPSPSGELAPTREVQDAK